jgi:hypothetical protein
VNFAGGSPGGAGPNDYNHLAPSLVPLNVVSFSTNAAGSYGYLLSNNGNTQTVTVTENTELQIGSYPTAFNALLDVKSTKTYQILLTAGEEVGEIASISGGQFTAVTTNLSQFVGTGQNIITFSMFLGLSVDDPAVTHSSPEPETSIRVTGTSTVTYLYGATVPEPASVVMMTLGLSAVAALRWRRHRAN